VDESETYIVRTRCTYASDAIFESCHGSSC
jgi:hypothetical protein